MNVLHKCSVSLVSTWRLVSELGAGVKQCVHSPVHTMARRILSAAHPRTQPSCAPHPANSTTYITPRTYYTASCFK